MLESRVPDSFLIVFVSAVKISIFPFEIYDTTELIIHIILKHLQLHDSLISANNFCKIKKTRIRFLQIS